jgi:beta-glucanase (GH16 family)
MNYKAKTTMKYAYLWALAIGSLCSLSCTQGDDSPPAPEDRSNYVPEGYKLVWNDEFDAPAANGVPGPEWWFETGNGGWGNNEPQYYADRVLGNDTVAKVHGGKLTITAFKLAVPYQGSDIISARMNTVQAWKYGYFEMKAKLPGGRGTWPAFWMLPKDFQSWPLDGEIDIMEYVGYRPNVAQSSVHTAAYNHVAGTEKTATINLSGPEEKFYTYALLWTEDEITAYVDGIQYFSFRNDGQGNKETWPFDKPFYLKLNLAIGGNWGGLEGIDDSIFPAQYEIDYVRVYQK